MKAPTNVHPATGATLAGTTWPSWKRPTTLYVCAVLDRYQWHTITITGKQTTSPGAPSIASSVSFLIKGWIKPRHSFCVLQLWATLPCGWYGFAASLSSPSFTPPPCSSSLTATVKNGVVNLLKRNMLLVWHENTVCGTLAVYARNRLKRLIISVE